VTAGIVLSNGGGHRPPLQRVARSIGFDTAGQGKALCGGGVRFATFGGASRLSRPAVILASGRRYAVTRQGRLVSSLAPPNGAITRFAMVAGFESLG